MSHIDDFARIYRRRFERMPTEMLERLAVESIVKARAVQGHPGPEFEDLMGQVRAADEILKARQAERAKQKKAKAAWPKYVKNMRKAAVLNLKNAISPNGQLVAAILEEEERGLTAQEIGGWCEELAALPEEELTRLLNGLVEEGIISKAKKGKYRLRTICTEDLWIRPEIDPRKADKRVQILLELLAEEECAISKEDLGDRLAKKDPSLSGEKAYPATEGDYAVDTLMCKYLHSYKVGDCWLYYYPMLGHKEG